MDFNILLGSWKSDLKEFGFSVDRVEIGNGLSNQKRLILGLKRQRIIYLTRPLRLPIRIL